MREELVVEGSLAEAASQVRASGAWFYWIAGLSMVNAIIAALDLGYGMIVGLGVTQVVTVMAEEMAPNLADIISLSVTALVCAVFVAFGWAACRFQLWAFIVGMALYALDSLVFLLVGDWVAVGFHGFVLFMLVGGLTKVGEVHRGLDELESAAAHARAEGDAGAVADEAAAPDASTG